MQLLPSAFTVREFTASDAEAVVSVLSADAPAPPSVREFAFRELEARASGDFRTRWVLEERGGPVVATAGLSASSWIPRDELALHLVVAPEARGRGCGSTLLAVARNAARTHGAARLRANVRDSDAATRVWYEHRGFTLLHHKVESELDLVTFDASTHEDASNAVTRAGIALTDLRAQIGEASGEARLLDFVADRLTETPDLRGLPRWTREQVRDALEREGARPEWTVVAQRGEEWLGLSILTAVPCGAYNFITAVRPDARGAGLARALKVEVIRRARLAGFTTMLAHNLGENTAMLAVNRRLGFRPRPGLWVMTGQVDDTSST